MTTIAFEDFFKRASFKDGVVRDDAVTYGFVHGGRYMSSPGTLTDGQFTGLTFTNDRKLRVDATLVTGDIEIGAVELKDGTTDTRATIDAANTARTTATTVLCVQPIDAAGNIIDSEESTPTTLTGGSKTVAAAGTAEALGASLATKSIYIRAKSTNTSFVCIGDSSVDESTNQQIILYANDSVTLDISNRATVYIDADVSNEGIDYLCMSWFNEF